MNYLRVRALLISLKQQRNLRVIKPGRELTRVFRNSLLWVPGFFVRHGVNEGGFRSFNLWPTCEVLKNREHILFSEILSPSTHPKHPVWQREGPQWMFVELELSVNRFLD